LIRKFGGAPLAVSPTKSLPVIAGVITFVLLRAQGLPKSPAARLVQSWLLLARSGWTPRRLVLLDRPVCLFRLTHCPERVQRRQCTAKRCSGAFRPSIYSVLVVPERLAVRRRVHRPPPRHAVVEPPVRSLPFRLTRFIGRESEIAELRNLLDEQRMITLAGPGGAGKTRLALALAASLPEVHFADLASVGSPDQVIRALADALGVRQEPGRPLAQTVAAYLRPRPAIVLLDNCEHLVSAAAELASALLRACPGLTILATSRIPLDLPGELVWAVPRLSLPEAEAASVMKSDAGRLFLDRARLVSRELQVDRRTAPQIASICAALDGLPLAIELAAGQAGVLSLEAIRSGLNDHLGLLKVEARVEGRHPTLRAALEWSYKRLDPGDQALFDSLAIFAGGFSDEAANAVAGATDAALRRLIKSSMLTTTPGSHAKYRLLETLRAFGRARLDETGRLSEVRARFLSYYADLAARADLGLRAREQRSWLDRLEAERPNLREAIRVGSRHNPTLAQQIFAGTTNFWSIRGYVEEGAELAESVVQAGGSHPDPRALVGLAEMMYEIDSTRGRAAVEAAARSRAGGLEVEARLDLVRAAHAHDAKEPGRGRDAAARALRAAVKLGREDLVVLAHGWLCKADMEEGRLAESRAAGERATALARTTGDDNLLGFALDQLGHLALKEGDLESASAYHRASLKAWQAVDTPPGVQHALMNIGLLALESGDGRAAERIFERSHALALASGDRLSLVGALHGLGQAAAMGGDVDETEVRFGAALKLSNEIASNHSIATSLRGLARAAFMRHQMARGLRLAAAAATIYPGHAGPLDRYPRQQLDAQITSARAAVGSRAADLAWSSGSGMNADAAVAYAQQIEPPSEGGPKLSPRERQIVALLTRGSSNKQIASALAISERTAEGHVERVRNKLGLANRAQVAAWGVEHRLR
jgi:predicted ATPase/DNA-binding CsgD family transcriptional regulator